MSGIKDTVASFANSATLPILNQSQTKSIPHLIPPYHEQVQIVEYIESQSSIIQQIVEKHIVFISLMQEYRTALISEAVTGKIDVRDEA